MFFSSIVQKGIHELIHLRIECRLPADSVLIIKKECQALRPHHGTHLHHADLTFAALGDITEQSLVSHGDRHLGHAG